MPEEPSVYPEPDRALLRESYPRMWTNRCRVVIPCFDLEQAQRIAERVSEFCSCDLEQLLCVTDDNPPTKILSETPMVREFYPLKVRAAEPQN